MSTANTAIILGATPAASDTGGDGRGYQSEHELEATLINILQEGGYTYLDITTESALVANLRAHLSRLNETLFSPREWEQLFKNYLANQNDSVTDKTTKVQQDYIYSLQRDDGSIKNVRILDKHNLMRNHVEVINQYEAQGMRTHRYDVTILVNGLPMVHIELKRRGVQLREAFSQINRYRRDSFWSGSGLFEYVQLFVISNGTHTKYYANTVRDHHLKEQKSGRKSRKTSHSFEFTNWWTNEENQRIADLESFAKSFFAKDVLLSIIIKYCVFTSESHLLVMRPYQIHATKNIVQRIAVATSHKQLSTTAAGGYIWHATGSGKTLTSFKTAQLASDHPDVDKVLFIVDRKDLDYQTMREYDKFQKGAANSNNSTAVLIKQLGDPNAKIIITTIQKMARFLKARPHHPVFHKHVVMIFDECHRSQFGSMHEGITKSFKRYHIFGFTGTPIFSTNAADSSGLNTTDQAFGERLHAYTLVDAIRDENVLPLKLECFNTLQLKDDVADKQVAAIDTQAAALAPKRIAGITKYILDNFNKKTKQTHHYHTKTGQQRQGFNSIFAVSSIAAARLYYAAFKQTQTDLKVTTIFSVTDNEAEQETADMGFLPDESFDTSAMELSSRDFLDGVIRDYNGHFGTNYDASPDQFENYYKDVSRRMKNRDLDILIVVNMFLTGFDATTLNTLWVDKNLRYHGLIQAFSRTNRILNSIKAYGHIVCFRDLEPATNEALTLFSNDDAHDVVLLRSFADYYFGYTDKNGTEHTGYATLIDELKATAPLTAVLTGENAEKNFIKLWGNVLRQNNMLSAFDEYEGQAILSEMEFQDYQSRYIDLYDKYRKSPQGTPKELIVDDIEFKMELVKQITVNIDYILNLIAKQQHSPAEASSTLAGKIEKYISASPELRSKKGLIMEFISTINADSNVPAEWRKFIDQHKTAELESIIAEENLRPEATRTYLDRAFRDGELKSTGTKFARIMPPTSMFTADNIKEQKKAASLLKLQLYFEKYTNV